MNAGGALSQLIDKLAASSDDLDAALAAVSVLTSKVASGAAIVSGGRTLAVAGLLTEADEADLVAAAEGIRSDFEVPGAGTVTPIVFGLPRCDDEFLLASRPASLEGGWQDVVQLAARALGPWLALQRSRAAEKHGRELNERQARSAVHLLESLREREELLQKTLKIQQSISHRAPLQEVLDAVTQGITDLLSADLTAVRLIDPHAPEFAEIVSSSGIRGDVLSEVRRMPVGVGAGGRAISEGRLIVMHRYLTDPDAIPAFSAEQVHAAMAAPVHEGGRVVGSLVAASLDPERRYSDAEQEALLMFAANVSIALTDAKTVDALRHAQEEKEMFLAMVSHELKTPLAVVQGVLHSLRVHEGIDKQTRERLLTSAAERTGDLQRLIDRMLEGARAELAGQEGEVHLPALIERLATDFGHGRRIAVAPVPDVVVELDEHALREVLGTLLENAVTHSPQGSQISIECAHADWGSSISIRNAGSLSVPDPGALFRAWQRGQKPSSSGVGLGLYIAGRIAQAIGCRIRAESEGGTVTFTVTVPRDRVRG